MHRLAAFVIVGASATARADVAAELSAGAGTESGGSGFGTASGTLAGELSGPAAPLEQRGLRIRESGNIWLFTGADPDERNGVRADVTASALASNVVGTAHAAARYSGWQLDLGVAYQPVGDLRDAFWRSGRRVVATQSGLDMPAMVTWGLPTGRAEAIAMAFRFTDRTRRAGAAPIDGGMDLALDAAFFRYRGASWSVDAIDFAVTSHEVIERETVTTTTGLDATELALDVLVLRYRVASSLELTARGGFDNTVPMMEFMTERQPTMYMEHPVPSVMTPRYWVELAEHTGERVASVGAGSWARLDPTGTAADAGQLASASFSDRFGRLGVRATAQGGRLRREMLGAYAPAGLPPVGTVMWMGRGELSASLRIGGDLELAGSAYIERSDRDDPRWLVPADGTVALHAGADVSARWQLGRRR